MPIHDKRLKIVKIAVLSLFFTVGFKAEAQQFNAFKIHKMTANEIRSDIGVIKGRLVEALSWTDNDGKKIFVLTQATSGQYGMNFKSELNALCFLKRQKALETIWSIKDFTNDSLSTVSYLDNSVSVLDIDKDGIAETAFLYQILKDGQDPNPLKLMLHTKGNKLAIRGQIPKHEEDLSEYRKEFDKSFDSYPAGFRDFASKKWDNAAKKELESFDLPSAVIYRKSK